MQVLQGVVTCGGPSKQATMLEAFQVARLAAVLTSLKISVVPLQHSSPLNLVYRRQFCCAFWPLRPFSSDAEDDRWGKGEEELVRF